MFSAGYSVDVNPSQLGVGMTIAKGIETSFSNIKSDLEEATKNIIDQGKSNHVDFSDLLDLDSVQEPFDNLNLELNICCDLAERQHELAEAYASGELAKKAKDNFVNSVDQMFCDTAKMYMNHAYPGVEGRVLATIGMAGIQFGEGFTSFFEGIGDGFVTLVGYGAGLFNQEVGQNIRDFAAIDYSKKLWEENALFEDVNRKSYFDKDSIYAKTFKLLGKTTGAVVTINGTAALLSRGTQATAIAEEAGAVTRTASTVSKVEKGVNATRYSTDATNTFRKKFEGAVKSGKDVKEAFLIGMAYAGSDLAFEKVGGHVGNKAQNIFKATEFGKSVKETIKSFEHEAENKVGKATTTVTKQMINTTKKTTIDSDSSDMKEQIDTSIQQDEIKAVEKGAVDVVRHSINRVTKI